MMKKALKQTDSGFSELYKALNKEQKQAVDTIDGPVMVIAGPGTGKTSILTLRIANILKNTDTAPENILALTFTESAAHNMRSRLVNIIGHAGYKVAIHTFHGFAGDIIRSYPEKFPRIIGSSLITDIEKISIVENIVNTLPLELLRPYGDPSYYIRSIISTIQELKRDSYTPEDLEKSLNKEEKEVKSSPDLYHEKGAHKGKMKGMYIDRLGSIEKNRELNTVYKEYQETLGRKKKYDFDDMLGELISVMKTDSDFLLILQETYQYILADEHQDANRSQNTILELLSDFHDNPNLFIVGDEKQAIFRFQGASLENFLYFSRKYKKAVVIPLRQNYRSHQHILDASHEVIENNPSDGSRERVRLSAGSSRTSKEKPIIVVEAPNISSEISWVVGDIGRKIRAGVKPHEIAVLYRNNSEAFVVGDALRRNNIIFEIESDQNILDSPDVSKLVTLIRVACDPSHDGVLSEALLTGVFNISPIDVLRTIRTASEKRVDFNQIAVKEFPDAVKTIHRWTRASLEEPLMAALELIVNDSQIVEKALSDNGHHRLSSIEAFYNKAREVAESSRSAKLKDLVAYIKTLEDHEVNIKSKNRAKDGAVRLMTVHRSKGLEFDAVYIVGAIESKWGGRSDRKSFRVSLIHGENDGGRIEDERRLFYVALTRARESVVVSYPLTNDDSRETLPSPFVSELKQDLVENIKAPLVNQLKEIQKSKVKSVNNSILSDVKYLNELFEEQGISVTALNNYLNCPWNYFFSNLVRLPQLPTKHQMYGTAVHRTLQVFFNKYREEADLSKNELLKIFEHYLSEQPLPTIDYISSLEKGKKSLSGYYDTYKSKWSRNIITEYKIGGVELPVNGVVVKLKGQLDKLEIVSDGVVNVVDYKTSKPTSRADIEGKTKSSNGNYKRQLVFYHLLLSLDDRGTYRMQSGELDFIEPDDKDRYKKEQFEITKDDIALLKTDIANMVEGVKTLSFVDKNQSTSGSWCKDKKCKYCALARRITR
jgi:DNA helicase-2/ATP-dependent DNA helicase PcrA